MDNTQKQLYLENLPMLYEKFDSYRRRAMLFFTPIPIGNNYEFFLTGKHKSPLFSLNLTPEVSVGVLFQCWKEYPKLFTVSDEDGKTGFVCDFTGSPMSHLNDYTAFNPDTGLIWTGKNETHYVDWQMCINDMKGIWDGLLKKEMVRLHEETFHPYSLEETIKIVSAL